MAKLETALVCTFGHCILQHLENASVALQAVKMDFCEAVGWMLSLLLWKSDQFDGFECHLNAFKVHLKIPHMS